MKTVEAKPFDQNAENWKRENRLFTSTVLEAGASGQNRIGNQAGLAMAWGLSHTFGCREHCFFDSSPSVRRRGVTFAQKFAAAPNHSRSKNDRACGKTWLKVVAMVIKWRPRTLCKAGLSKKKLNVSAIASTVTQVLPAVLHSNSLQLGRESLPQQLCIGNTCELVYWEVHATVLQDDGVEFGAYQLCFVVIYVSEWRPSRRVDKKERSCSFLQRGEQKLP